MSELNGVTTKYITKLTVSYTAAHRSCIAKDKADTTIDNADKEIHGGIKKKIFIRTRLTISCAGA